MLIIKRSELYYTASGIITPIGGRTVHRLRESSANLCKGRSPTGVTIPEAVLYCTVHTYLDNVNMTADCHAVDYCNIQRAFHYVTRSKC